MKLLLENVITKLLLATILLRMIRRHPATRVQATQAGPGLARSRLRRLAGHAG
jgi:hypothetical protein